MEISRIQFPVGNETNPLVIQVSYFREVMVSEWLIIFTPLFTSINFDAKNSWPPLQTKHLLLWVFSQKRLFSERTNLGCPEPKSDFFNDVLRALVFLTRLEEQISLMSVDTLPSIQHFQSLPHWVNCNLPHFTALILASVGTSTSCSALISEAAMWIDH